VHADSNDSVVVNGVDLPLRECSPPLFSGHDIGLLVLDVFGVFFMVLFLLTTIALIVALLKFKKLTVPLFCAVLVFLLIGAPLLGTGAYYSRWEKVYAVNGDCDALPKIDATFPLPNSALQTPVNMTIAYVGDSGAGINAINVYQLIAAENAEAVILLGDFDYCDDSTLWGRQLRAALGDGFPIIPVMGNHELHVWEDYSDIISDMDFWQNPPEYFQCSGTRYVNYWCVYRGLFLAFSSVATACGDGYQKQGWHERELSDMLDLSYEEGFDNPFVNCIWHKNHKNFEVSSSRAEVQDKMYDLCAERGALIVNGHDHVFGRTHNFRNAADPTPVTICERGDESCFYQLQNSSIVVVAGLGGWERSPIEFDDLGEQFATVSNSEFGALFCVYNFNGNSDQVYCYFKTVSGFIVDEFYFKQKSFLESNN